MNGFFEELDFIAQYFSPKGKPCTVYTFSPDTHAFDIRISVAMPRNNPYALIETHGMPNLYYAWGRQRETLPESPDERASSFDMWLRETPEEEIRHALPLVPIQEYWKAPA